MNKFWLFAGSIYYPSGGMRDFRGEFDSVKDATEAFRTWCVERGTPTGQYEWAHVYSVETGNIVTEVEREFWPEAA